MQFRGVILEGNSHAGKTSTLKSIKKLQANDEFSERSIIVLGEHYSQILNNVQGQYISLNHSDHLKLLQDRVDMLYKLFEWATYLGPASRKSRGLFFVLERFHLNHLVAFGDSAIDEIRKLELQLVQLGAKCVLLTISNEIVKERIQSRNPDEWKDKKQEEILESCSGLINAQNSYKKYAKTSLLETIELNTDDKDWDKYASDIMDVL
jgi:hypothetical protein